MSLWAVFTRTTFYRGNSIYENIWAEQIQIWTLTGLFHGLHFNLSWQEKHMWSCPAIITRVQGLISLQLYNTRLYNKIHVVVSLCYTHTKNKTEQKTINYDGVRRRNLKVTARGKKLLWRLVVQQWILLYRLPDGSRVNRLWLRWVLSFYANCTFPTIKW